MIKLLSSKRSATISKNINRIICRVVKNVSVTRSRRTKERRGCARTDTRRRNNHIQGYNGVALWNHRDVLIISKAHSSANARYVPLCVQ